MRWMITGAGGQLAHHLLSQLSSESDRDDVLALTKADLDITSESAVHDAIASL